MEFFENLKEYLQACSNPSKYKLNNLMELKFNKLTQIRVLYFLIINYSLLSLCFNLDP